jgi:hypothetical protein
MLSHVLKKLLRRDGRLVIFQVLLIFGGSGALVGATTAQAAGDIYFFHSNVSPTYSQNMSHIMSPTMISLGVGQDLDTLDIAVDFSEDLTQNSFVGYQLFNESNATYGFEIPQLRISLVPNSGSIFGINGGTINASTNIAPYYSGVPQSNTSWAGPGLFSPPNNSVSLGNCTVTSRWTNPNQMLFSILRSCTQLPAQFNVMAEVVHLSPINQTIQSVTGIQYPGLGVDLMKVPGYKLDQKIVAQSPQNIYVTQGATQLSASSSAQLPLVYSVPATQSVCSVPDLSSPTVKVFGIGKCDVVIAAPGNDKYQSAPPVQVSFQVLAALTQSISQDLPKSISLENPQISFQANSTSGTRVSASSKTPSICQVTSNQAIFASNSGVCQIVFSAPSAGPYDSAQLSVEIQITPKRATQKVSFTPPGEVHLGGPEFHLDVKNEAQLPMNVTSDTLGVCDFTQNNNLFLVSAYGAGTCSFSISIEGNDQYLPFYATNITFDILEEVAPPTDGGDVAPPTTDGGGDSGGAIVIAPPRPRCPTGTKLVGGICKKPIDVGGGKKCPTGTKLVGGICKKNITSTAPTHPQVPPKIVITSSAGSGATSVRIPSKTASSSLTNSKSTVTTAAPTIKPKTPVKITAQVNPPKSGDKKKIPTISPSPVTKKK